MSRPHGIMVGWKAWADSPRWAEDYRRVYHLPEKEGREMDDDIERLRIALQRIADFKPSEVGADPYEQIAVFAKATARYALNPKLQIGGPVE
jgi:hypothetical protein